MFESEPVAVQVLDYLKQVLGSAPPSPAPAGADLAVDVAERTAATGLSGLLELALLVAKHQRLRGDAAQASLDQARATHQDLARRYDALKAQLAGRAAGVGAASIAKETVMAAHAEPGAGMPSWSVNGQQLDKHLRGLATAVDAATKQDCAQQWPDGDKLTLILEELRRHTLILESAPYMITSLISL